MCASTGSRGRHSGGGIGGRRGARGARGGLAQGRGREYDRRDSSRHGRALYYDSAFRVKGDSSCLWFTTTLETALVPRTTTAWLRTRFEAEIGRGPKLISMIVTIDAVRLERSASGSGIPCRWGLFVSLRLES